MRMKMFSLLTLLLFIFALSSLTGCKSSYFAVPNQAMGVPGEFAETETAIQKAEKSLGAKFAPEKMAKAKGLAQEGVQAYWDCRTKEGLAMLAEARKLAGEATLVKTVPPLKPVKVVVKPSPKPVKAIAPPPTPKEKIVLQGPNFAFDSAELTPVARLILTTQAGILKGKPNVKVKIVGHTDNIGTEEYNLGLSERRARAVEEYLRSKGIDPSHLETEGRGSSQPIAPNDTKEGRVKNRRVEFKVLE